MNFLVLGAGKQGIAITHDILSHGNHTVTLADRDRTALEAAQRRFPQIAVMEFDVNELGVLARQMAGIHVCVSAVPYFYNLVLAKTAVENRVHFCDLGGNTQIVLKELRLDAEARAAGVAVIPDCGLSPGMTNVLAAHAISKLTRVDVLEMRVGGLPIHPVPPLNYQLVFSNHGLLNQYIEPAVVVEGGIAKRVDSMTGVESVVFEGYPNLEAFYTYGGISTLPESYRGRVPSINEKTVRYTGHAEAMRRILKDPQFKSRSDIGTHLEKILPKEGPDVVLVRVTAIGAGRADIEVIDVADPQTGFTATMRTTGFSAAIVAGMMAEGRIPPGAHVQEKVIPTAEFIAELGKRGIRVKETLTEVES